MYTHEFSAGGHGASLATHRGEHDHAVERCPVYWRGIQQHAASAKRHLIRTTRGGPASIARHRAEFKQRVARLARWSRRRTLCHSQQQQFRELGSASNEYACRQFVTGHSASHECLAFLSRPMVAVAGELSPLLTT